MKNRHATDLDIQKFTFDKRECASEMVQHIRSCTICSERVDAYFSLSTMIKAQPEPDLDFNLSNLVFEQLPSSKETKTNASYLINFVVLIIIGFLVLSLFLLGKTILYLLDKSLIQQTYFIISIIIFISAFLVFDQFRSFNKKIKMVST